MNKNWLYRVLAMALIALLALPAFAMAEEVQTDAVEAAVEDNEVVLGGNEVANDIVANVEYGFYLTEDGLFNADGEVEEIDIGNIDEKKFEVTWSPEEDSHYADFKSVKWTIKPSSAASIKKLSDSTAVVTLKKKCEKVTLKVAGKYSFDGEDYTKSRHTFVEATFEVKDEHKIDKIKANYSEDEFVPDYPSKDETKTSYKVDIGKGKVVIPFAANADGESIDYMVEDEEAPANDNWGKYAFKWSNKKVGQYQGSIDGNFDSNIIDLAEIDGSDMSDYTVFFKKKGSTKVTFTSQYDKKKKASVNFKVSIPSKYDYKAANSDKPKASKDKNKIELVVKSAKYTDAETLEVTVWVANGSGKELRGAIEGVNVVTRRDEIGVEGVMKFEGTIKKQKTGTAKIKYKLSDETMVLDDGDLFDIGKGVYVDEESVADALIEKTGADDVVCNAID